MVILRFQEVKGTEGILYRNTGTGRSGTYGSSIFLKQIPKTQIINCETSTDAVGHRFAALQSSIT